MQRKTIATKIEKDRQKILTHLANLQIRHESNETYEDELDDIIDNMSIDLQEDTDFVEKLKNLRENSYGTAYEMENNDPDKADNLDAML